MTYAEYIERNTDLTAGEMLRAAEVWYNTTHTQADAETASAAVKLTEWLASEVEGTGEQRTKAECTVVTTLTVTNVVRGTDAKAPSDWLAETLAETARRSAWAGYKEHVMHAGQPDDISVSSVQVFKFDEPRIAAATQEGSEA